jgi:hypothetical protein
MMTQLLAQTAANWRVRMVKKFFLIAFFVMLVFLPVSISGEIPAHERSALIALYNATAGWRFTDGWKAPPLHTDGFAMPGTEGNWFGITVENDHVTGINLFRNYLLGTLPPELGNLSHLENLGLSNNYGLTGSIPPELGKLSNLKTFSAWLTGLSGPIPPELGNLKNLEYLDLGTSQISGSIPPELGNLNSLIELKLGSNRLSGSIPSELGNLSSLENLYLESNRLSGSIPSELGNLSNLVNLFLQSNRLSGSIPSELGNLSKLYFLRLSRNRLTGKIPTSFLDLQSTFMTIYYNGLYTNNNTLHAFLDKKCRDWASTQTIAPEDVSVTLISSFSARVSWTPIAYTGDTGGYRVFYRANSGGSWTFAGMTADKLASFFEVHGLEQGLTYCFAVQTRTNPHDENPNTVDSQFSKEVCSLSGTPGPFGAFETPGDGSTVKGSIPVSGWALDDLGVASVKIYREENQSLVYIGEAVLVEGARPDVEQAYPDYPNNNKAGWGYMMLTNFLPNDGNGTFAIHAIVTDMEGNQTTLGIKTIICDNANAVKPFGTIDTPTQGGTASGSNFINWGWVLTPQPNSIPTNSSTINVYVDGVNLGHPFYNIYRSDIANLFPDYANSNGASGYFYLDTSAYENGVHTIQWTATDSGGNSEGIGSRYFSIQNTGKSQSKVQIASSDNVVTDGKFFHISQIADIPINDLESIGIKRGLKDDIDPEVVSSDESGVFIVKTEEMGRLVINLCSKPGVFAGYTEFGNHLRPLPIGSTLDIKTGRFYWQPGPGFVGYYRFVFIEKNEDNQIKKKNIIVMIEPKFLKSKQ